MIIVLSTGLTVCFYQVHHHVHWAGFDGVNSMHKLLDLFKGRSVGRVMRATSSNQLRKHRWVKTQQNSRDGIFSHRVIFIFLMNVYICLKMFFANYIISFKVIFQS